MQPNLARNLLFVFLCLPSWLAALTLASAPAVAAAEDMTLIGRGHYRVLAWPIYDATLRAAQEPFQFPDTVPFELTLEYKRHFTAAQIVAETLNQWEKQEIEVESGWRESLLQAIPDIEAGDTLVQLVDERHTSHFFHNERLVASISNREFSIALAGIWLGTNTSAPRLRRQLLGIHR